MTAIASPVLANSRAIADDLAALAERLNPVIVQIRQKGGGNGAGVIWRGNGIIVTNHHVVKEDRVDVWTHAGEHFTGIVAARHPDRDLAIVKIAAEGLPSAEIGDSSTIRPGQIAFAIGHPVGYRMSLSLGIVTASPDADPGWIRTDATMMPGNSGGPLFDARGQVIGIGTMVQGALSLAVPSAIVEHFVAGDHPGNDSGYLGLDGQIVALRSPVQATGFVVVGVAEGGPAERAGLIVGDVILAIGGEPVVDEETLPASLLRLRPGTAASLAILRGGEPLDLAVTPGGRA